MAGIILEDVSRVFPGQVAAVNRLNLEVGDGELLALVGPSGSGKTTVLRLITGLECPSSGTVRIGGRPVNGLAPRHRDLAMVFQGHSLYPHLNVHENMAFSLRLRQASRWRRLWGRLAGGAPKQAGTPRRAFPTNGTLPGSLVPNDRGREPAIDDAVRQAAISLGIEKLLTRMPNELSGGERQRVALGRAIVRRPAAFLFDEPLSGLDAQLRVQMRQELKQLHRRLQTTTIYVTHDQVEALALGNRVAVIDRGELQQIGQPLALYDEPANRFVAGFVGSPAMNFMDGTLVVAQHPECDARLMAGGWSLQLPPDRLPASYQRTDSGARRELTLGIRPEDIRVTIEPHAPPAANEGGEREWTSLGLAQIEALEALGDATILHLRPFLCPELAERPSPDAVNSLLLGKVTGRIELKAGNRVSAWCDWRRAHWFASDSGRRLGSPRSDGAGH